MEECHEVRTDQQEGTTILDKHERFRQGWILISWKKTTKNHLTFQRKNMENS